MAYNQGHAPAAMPVFLPQVRCEMHCTLHTSSSFTLQPSSCAASSSGGFPKQCHGGFISQSEWGFFTPLLWKPPWLKVIFKACQALQSRHCLEQCAIFKLKQRFQVDDSTTSARLASNNRCKAFTQVGSKKSLASTEWRTPSKSKKITSEIWELCTLPMMERRREESSAGNLKLFQWHQGCSADQQINSAEWQEPCVDA